MTRKRFIKMLMSIGNSRNKAHELQKSAIIQHGSYQEAFKAIKRELIETKINEIAEKLIKALQQPLLTALEAVKKAILCCKQKFKEIAEAVQKAKDKHSKLNTNTVPYAKAVSYCDKAYKAVEVLQCKIKSQCIWRLRQI
ncbi:MAG: hypothetical protein MJ120_00120 [Clostridia bacterium]|nr:hypothetical protein [Clostridia bacterium]